MKSLKSRRKRLLPTMVLTVAVCALFAGPYAASAARDGTINVTWSSNPAIPGFHCSVSGLPAVFADHEPNCNLYYTNDVNMDAVYCIDRKVDVADSKHDERPTPNRDFTAEQQALLKHILRNGAKKYGKNNLEMNKLQIATQLAVWMVTEKYYNDENVMNLVLHKKDGDVYENDAFAPTPEIGRMARALLVNAKQNAERPIASFLTEVNNAPQEFFTDSNEFHLEDTNKVLLYDWGNGTLQVKDSQGLSVFVNNDVMDIYGFDASDVTVEFDYHVSGELLYLTPIQAANAQKMARYVANDADGKLLHVRLRKGVDEPEPPSEPQPPETEPPITPPTDKEPPGTTPPGTEPPETTPPAVEPPPGTEPPETTPPAVNPPPDTKPPEATPPAVNPPPDTKPPEVTTRPGVTVPPTSTTPPGIVTSPAVTTPPGIVTSPAVTTPPSSKSPPSSSGSGKGALPPQQKPAETPKAAETPPPAQQPIPSALSKPSEAPSYVAGDAKAPTGSWEWNDSQQNWEYKPSGKLPKTGAVLESGSAPTGTAQGKTAREAVASALAAIALGMVLRLRRMGR
ncbi:MAG: Cys-Gln thioester bond-forming surface protein [Clostridiales Family XIII bacterium]|jgi:hypothetical protein|nr:Cys-Gln thioester bond-forming surface protein [Clostridiales Family XIII bacterium]